MVVIATEDAVVLRKGVMLFEGAARGVVEEDPRDVLQGAHKEHRGMTEVSLYGIPQYG
jgi:hypothetical protein